MKAYSAYKDSGLPWVGKIPAHWDVFRGKRLFTEMNRPVRDEDGVVTAFRDGVVTLRSKRRTEGFTNSILEIGYQGIRKGDLVIHQMDGAAGAIGVSDSDGKGTPVYIVCVPRADANTYYYGYLLRQMARSGYIYSLAKGIRERSTEFRWSEFSIQDYPVPPREEQDAIVSFLDSKLADIDRYIAEKERLIELLQEQKTAIINQAVTRGINPQVRMKDSGIEWLGEIPEGWEINSLKQIASVRLSGVDKHTYENEIPVKLCNYTDVYNRDFITPDLDFMLATATESETRNFALAAGDVLVTKDSETWDDIAVPAYVPQNLDDVICGYHLALIRPKKQRVNGEFLFRALSAPQIEYQSNISANGVTRYGLSKYAIKNVLVPMPPINEQEEICKFITREIEKINISIVCTQKEITLIEEYRTALIAEAVTGKMDVRAIHE